MSKKVAIVYNSSRAKQAIDSLAHTEFENYQLYWFNSLREFVQKNDDSIFFDKIIISARHISGLRPDDPRISETNLSSDDVSDPRVSALLDYVEYLKNGSGGIDGGTTTIMFVKEEEKTKTNILALFEELFGDAEKGNNTPSIAVNITALYLSSLIKDDKETIFNKTYRHTKLGTQEEKKGTAPSTTTTKKKVRKRGLFGFGKVEEVEVEETNTAVTENGSTSSSEEVIDEHADSIDLTPNTITDSNTDDGVTDVSDLLDVSSLYAGESETGVYEDGEDEEDEVNKSTTDSEVDESDTSMPLDEDSPNINLPVSYILDKSLESKAEDLAYLDFDDSVNLYWDSEFGRWYTESGYLVVPFIEGSEGYPLYNLTYAVETQAFYRKDISAWYTKDGSFWGYAEESQDTVTASMVDTEAFADPDDDADDGEVVVGEGTPVLDSIDSTDNETSEDVSLTSEQEELGTASTNSLQDDSGSFEYGIFPSSEDNVQVDFFSSKSTYEFTDLSDVDYADTKKATKSQGTSKKNKILKKKLSKAIKTKLNNNENIVYIVGSSSSAYKQAKGIAKQGDTSVAFVNAGNDFSFAESLPSTFGVSDKYSVKFFSPYIDESNLHVYSRSVLTPNVGISDHYFDELSSKYGLVIVSTDKLKKDSIVLVEPTVASIVQFISEATTVGDKTVKGIVQSKGTANLDSILHTIKEVYLPSGYNWLNNLK